MTEKRPDEDTAQPDPLEALEQRAAAAEAEQLDQETTELAGELTTRDEAKAREDERTRAAEMGATLAVSFGETLLAFWNPEVQIPKDRKQKLVEKTAPVLRKYDAGLPPWLKPYQEEIDLGMTVASVGFGIAMEMRKRKREEQAAAAARRPGATRPGTTTHPDQDLKRDRGHIPHATPGTVISGSQSEH